MVRKVPAVTAASINRNDRVTKYKGVALLTIDNNAVTKKEYF